MHGYKDTIERNRMSRPLFWTFRWIHILSRTLQELLLPAISRAKKMLFNFWISNYQHYERSAHLFIKPWRKITCSKCNYSRESTSMISTDTLHAQSVIIQKKSPGRNSGCKRKCQLHFWTLSRIFLRKKIYKGCNKCYVLSFERFDIECPMYGIDNRMFKSARVF